MKKVSLVLGLLAICLVIISCQNSQPEKAIWVSPISSVRTIWTLHSPVVAVEQKIRNYDLPSEFYQIFPQDSLGSVDYKANSLKKMNQLPAIDGNYECVRGALYLCWPLNTKTWDGTKHDPRDYLYVVNYLGQLLAVTFPDSLTMQCVKIKAPDVSIKSDSVINLPKFDHPVTWKWSFVGSSQDCKHFAKGKIIDFSAQAGHTSVTTTWRGGGKYILPSYVSTSIQVDNKYVYADQ